MPNNVIGVIHIEIYSFQFVRLWLSEICDPFFEIENTTTNHKILICLQRCHKYSITIWYDKIPAVIKYKVRLISHLLSCTPLNPHNFNELLKTCFLRYRNINYHDVIYFCHTKSIHVFYNRVAQFGSCFISGTSR